MFHSWKRLGDFGGSFQSGLAWSPPPPRLAHEVAIVGPNAIFESISRQNGESVGRQWTLSCDGSIQFRLNPITALGRNVSLVAYHPPGRIAERSVDIFNLA